MAAAASEWRAKLDEFLHDHRQNPRFTKFLETIETKIGVNRRNIVIGLGIFVALYLVWGFGKHLVCNLIGFAYPAYASMKAIESPAKDDDTKWLTYWVVYSVFSIIESVTDILFSWIPLYFLLKCVFLIYCMIPGRFNGSIFIYNTIVRPFFKKHERNIDSGMQSVSNAGKDAYNAAEKAADRLIKDGFTNSSYKSD